MVAMLRCGCVALRVTRGKAHGLDSMARATVLSAAMVKTHYFCSTCNSQLEKSSVSQVAKYVLSEIQKDHQRRRLQESCESERGSEGDL